MRARWRTLTILRPSTKARDRHGGSVARRSRGCANVQEWLSVSCPRDGRRIRDEDARPTRDRCGAVRRMLQRSVRRCRTGCGWRRAARLRRRGDPGVLFRAAPRSGLRQRDVRLRSVLRGLRRWHTCLGLCLSASDVVRRALRRVCDSTEFDGNGRQRNRLPRLLRSADRAVRVHDGHGLRRSVLVPWHAHARNLQHERAELLLDRGHTEHVKFRDVALRVRAAPRGLRGPGGPLEPHHHVKKKSYT